MKLIFGLMLLLKTAACLERNCSFYQSVPCYAALGHKLSLQMVDASRYSLKIQKIISSTEKDPVCRVKNDTMKNCDLFNNRPEVSVINGTLIINRVIRADSGTYKLYLEDSKGTETSTDLQVIVEDKDAGKTQVILGEELGPPITPIVLGCFAVILIALVIMAYYFYKKKNQLKPTTTPVSDGPEPVNEHISQKNREEEQKRTDEYATIDSQNKNKKKKKEEEVHYGEVTFTNSRVQQPPKMQEDCVYSEVQTR
ncbi:uncharacterized protein si:zfos-741a10.3 isoform X2 [Ctenopharyngodon idella]|uniref:uncharacterized protein si:zfos-741a10.3 isoform X2 n=1 Tax=Ctenopharyngodon idella TaxID=7959 RepID=UPI00222F2127|nr:uncharacterized protein si:zfos-741a10.3 isoform X2 [Ctenopharyngodon idella]